MLKIVGLTKKIGQKKIVDNLSFTVNKGEIFGLLGQNGAGKTTTLRMIVSLFSKTSGKIYINGIDSEKDFIKAMEHVGAIIENPEMYDFLSGYKNLFHFARMTRCRITKEQIEEVVKLVELQDAINNKVKTYSLGMRQRLGIAQAVLHNPSLLILDEPTNGLDPQGIYKLRNYLREIAVQGTSILISSHLLSEMQLLCDRVAIIDEGNLLQISTVTDLVKNSNNQKIVEFIVNHPIQAKAIILKVFPEITITLNKESIVLNIPEDSIAVINQELVKKNIIVTGINTKQDTLEEKFLKLTKAVDL